MSTHRTGFALALAALLVLGARARAEAGGNSYIGQEPPSLHDDKAKSSVRMKTTIGMEPLKPGQSSSESSMETPGGYSTELKDHLGKVVLIYFFNDSQESARELRNVGRIYERYRDHERDIMKDGAHKKLDFHRDRLVLFCITDDTWGSDIGPKDKLGEFTDKASKAALQVSICPTVVKNYGITSYPQKYLVDRTGKVVLEGKFSMDAVSQIVDEDEKAGAEPPKAEYSAKFDAALKAAREGDFAKATAEASKLEKDKADGENAKALLKWIDDLGKSRLSDGDAAKEACDVFAARDIYTLVSKKWPAKSACANDAKEKLAALKADADFRAVFAVEKTWNEAVAAEKAKDVKKAAELFKKCGRSCPWSPFIDRCEERIEALDAK